MAHTLGTQSWCDLRATEISEIEISWATWSQPPASFSLSNLQNFMENGSMLPNSAILTGTIPRAMGLGKTAPTRLKIRATSGFLGITTTWKIWMGIEGWVPSHTDCPRVYRKLGSPGLPLLERFHLRWLLAKLIIRPYALSEDHGIPLGSLFLYLRREAWNNEIVALCIPPQKDQSLMPVFSNLISLCLQQRHSRILSNSWHRRQPGMFWRCADGCIWVQWSPQPQSIGKDY